ncbi:MAG: TIM-barrel domain-containing protein [Kiritimatiellia bacterium]
MSNGIQASVTVGDVRVQPLGAYLVRIEQRGPKGFEERETFTANPRAFAGAEATETREDGSVCIATAHYRVVVPVEARGIEGIRVEPAGGGTACVLSNAMLSKKFLPEPSALPSTWVLGDAPRAVPPARGALPPPEGEEDATSGWDLANDAPDAYVFFPASSGYETFRADFLRLTGGIPLVPLYALGLWYSRYFPYDESTALATIDRFRQSGIPLDLFTLDTDWRVGASCGYAVNETLFPDLGRFVRKAHERNVRVMLNDHPEPKGKSALDPEELRFRRKGLTSLLAQGVDLWWFDRNWHTHLQAPAPGLEKETWGMRLYHDVTREFRPERRPLIMSNADGINNGRMDAPSHPAAHRFPVWWTGDTVAEWPCLRMGVANGVDGGIRSLLPYVHEDLGGHHGQPDRELYVRFMQYGAFSPVARIHCTTKVHRYPWEYGAAAEKIVGDFFRLRYRLLPTLYAAAHEAHRTGMPLLRRCDLAWPDFPEAADNTQFLLGDDLLVAPVAEPAGGDGIAGRTVWLPPGEWQDLWSGKNLRGPATIGARCALEEIPVFVRRGGMVFSIPQRQSTGEATWPELVVDAFVPETDGESVRFLCEDDGISMAYECGGFSRTAFALRQTGKETRIRAEPCAARRTVTLRIHLPPGAGAASGAAGFTAIAPGDRAAELFAGPGSAPPPEAGSVLEWRGDVEAGAAAEWRILRTP